MFIVHAVPSAPMQRILYEVYRDRAAYELAPAAALRAPSSRPTGGRTCWPPTSSSSGLQQAKVSPFPSVAELFGEPGYDTSGFERPDYLRDYGSLGQPGAQRRPGEPRQRGSRCCRRPGCHLCDEARAVIERVAADLGVPLVGARHHRSPRRISTQYWEMIPVTLVDGVQHDFWRVSEDRLRAALRGSTAARCNA